MKSWFCGIFALLLSFNVNAKTFENISFLQGKEIIWSSPYQKGSEAKIINVNKVFLDEDFFDNGKIHINNNNYSIDQLFIKNENGQFENLSYFFDYNGIGSTFFIQYYDKDRLSVNDEILLLKDSLKKCTGNYDASDISSMENEILQKEKCLNEIFYKLIDLFYTKSKDEIISSYKELTENIKNNYFLASNPDYCYGKCGTISYINAHNKILEIKQKIIEHFIANVDISNI